MKKPNREGQRQISFYCAESFWETVHAEKVRRGMSIQQMAVEALVRFFSRPTSREIEDHRKQEERAAEQLEKTGSVAWKDLPPRFEMSRWLDLCVRYYQQMPKAKRDLLEEYIILDLKHYASSRIKTPKD